jgi:hypothetical protein
MKQFLHCLSITVVLLCSNQTSSIAGVISTLDDFAAPGKDSTAFSSGSENFSLNGCGVCESDRMVSAEPNVVPFTSDSLPSAPASGNNEYTYDGTVKTASAIVGKGETVVWYASSNGGVPILAPSGTSSGNYSAYAEARNRTTGFRSSDRTLITLKINKAKLIITADAQSKVYGDANPVLTFSYSGWKNGDTRADLTKEPTAVSTLMVNSPVAKYINDIILSGGEDENYDFVYVPATFEVTEALLTVKVNSQSRVYGSVNPDLTFNYSGFKNSEDEFDLADLTKTSTSIGPMTPAGVYKDAIVASGGSSHNYELKYVPASFEVTEAVLKVVSDAQANSLCPANSGENFQGSRLEIGEKVSAPDVKPSATNVTQTTAGEYFADTFIPTDSKSSARQEREKDDNKIRWF